MSNYIQRTKLWEDVADQMIERIRTGRWEVGMKLPSEPEIAELFGVSRATVRSAIKLLQISGILRSRSGSGTYVADSAPAALETRELALVMSDPENLSSLVQTRYILEPQLAALSAGKASPSEVRRLFEIVTLMEQNQDRHSLMTYGYQFHQAVAKYSHNQVLFGFYQSVARQLRGLRVLDSLTLEIFVEGIDEHRAIAKAIAERDEALAKQLMRSHLRKDYGAYLERPEMLES